MKNIQTGKYHDSDFLNTIFVIKSQKVTKNKDKNDNMIYSIIKYLEMIDICNLKFSCKTISKEINDKVIKKYFKILKITGKMRFTIWYKYLNINK